LGASDDTECFRSFTLPLQPLAKRSYLDTTPGSSPPSPAASKKEAGPSLILDTSNAREMSVAFQEFYDSIEEELRKDKSWAGYTQRRTPVDDGGDNVGEQATEHASEHDLVEQRVEGAMELVEGCITTVFYDQ